MEYGTRIKRMDVMLIDPDKVSRGNLGALLRDFGCYSVRPFEDCETPIVSIISKPPSVVFCNWDPDQKFAESILHAVRHQNLDKVAATPVILVSRNLNRRVMSDGLRAGATQFMASPVVPADLIKKLNFVLSDKRSMTRQNGRLVYTIPPRKLVKRNPVEVNVVEFVSKPVETQRSALCDATEKKRSPAKNEMPKSPDDILEL